MFSKWGIFISKMSNKTNTKDDDILNHSLVA